MDFRNFFKSSSNEIYEHNMDLLEEHGLLNTFGSPNKVFLKFLKSRNIKIKSDKLTEEIIEEFEFSSDSVNLRAEKIKKQKETIVKQRSVWINIDSDGELIGTDLHLSHDAVIIENTKIPYSEMSDIEITEGGWSKKKFKIHTLKSDITFEINENMAVPLKEILEDNIAHQNHDEIDDLLDLYNLYEEGLISEEEFELRKAVIYSDDAYCTNCGYKLEPNSEFCSNCGHEVTD